MGKDKLVLLSLFGDYFSKKNKNKKSHNHT